MVSCYAHQTHRGHRVQQARWLAIFGKDPPTPSGTEHWILGHQGLQPRALTVIYVWASRRGMPLIVWCVSPPATNRNACSFTIHKRICESGTLLIGLKVFQEASPRLISEREDLEDSNKREWRYKGWSTVCVIIFAVLSKNTLFACLCLSECICLRFGNVMSDQFSQKVKCPLSETEIGYKIFEN